MKRFLAVLLFALLMAIGVPAVHSQTEDAARVRTREQLTNLLDRAGPKINVSFRQSQKQPFNFIGVMKDGLTNADSLEIVIGVTAKQTISFRIYPHYKGGYLNVDKINNRIELMRNLLLLSDTSSFIWGIDESGDIFAGYNFTLESGFPDAALTTVLRNIRNVDKFVGDMKPIFNG